MSDTNQPQEPINWVVLKFGGTSVSSSERWNTIVRIVRERIEEGYKPIIVCSALSGISNLLDQLLQEAVRGEYEDTIATIRSRHVALGDDLGVDAKAILEEDIEELSRLALGASLIREGSPRLQARMMAMGELLSTKLGAAFMAANGLDVLWRDARDVLRAEETHLLPEQRRYLSATCRFDPDAVLQAELRERDADVVITQGFIASNGKGETVLLGRGGSDTSASYLAAKLVAERLEIWTDVPGMFTANPHEIPSARLLRRLDYMEGQELATMGAKILHPRCLQPVEQLAIPLYVKCTDAPHLEGTIISDKTPDFGAQIKAIAAKTDVTLISMESLGMWQEVGFLADVFGTFKRHGLSIDLVATSETNVTVSLDPVANALDPARVDALLEDLNAYCRAEQIGPCAVVSLIGRNIRSLLHEMGPAFEVFQEQHIHQVSQAASDLNFSFVVDEGQASRLVRKLHANLFGKREPDLLFGPTWKELMGDADEDRRGGPAWWQTRRDELIEIARSTAPTYVYDEDTVRQALEDVRSIDAVDRVFYSMKANSHRDILRIFYEAGLGFECVSPEEMDEVLELFPNIARERILFTPNFAPAEEYRRGFELGAHVTLDNLYPLEAWPDVFRDRELIVRVDPGRGHGHHKYVRTAGSQSKFGVAPAELPRLEELASSVGASVVGVHAHVGSGIISPETWAETAVFLATLTKRFPDVRYIDVGGGLGVSERQSSPELDLKEVTDALRSFKKANPDLELWMEPGRFMVARAGVLLARVTQTKQKGSARYVGVETGMNSLLRPALYGAYHEIVNLSKLDEPLEITADVVGPICETGDVLGYGRRLPATEEGDVLLIATAGAYGYVMSNRYNMRSPAGEVLLQSATVTS
ncbi:MAG: bifunctional aspartate kinase/diaminopimelate decarboxylase [Rhodothermales bacterium]